MINGFTTKTDKIKLIQAGRVKTFKVLPKHISGKAFRGFIYAKHHFLAEGFILFSQD